MTPPKQPERPGKEEVRARLKAFLRQGEAEDVASVLVHTLNHRAEKLAETRAPRKRKSPKEPIGPTEKP